MSPRRDPDPSASSIVTAPALAMTTMDDDVRESLLRAQRGMLDERQRLPQVRIMNGGVGMFEFGDSHDSIEEFQGVILGAHQRNVLWEKPYGVSSSNEPTVPACTSNDGKFGVPRQGFRHAALPRPAVGTERINCRECPYNQWSSKGLIPALLRPGENAETTKGKAVVNQRAVYVMVEDRVAPVELLLPPTSITAFDEYLGFLLNRKIPVQAVLTTFGQEVKERGRLTWGQATFTQGDSIPQEMFSRVLAVRQEWLSTIEGTHEELVVANDVAEPETVTEPEVRDEEIPF